VLQGNYLQIFQEILIKFIKVKAGRIGQNGSDRTGSQITIGYFSIFKMHEITADNSA